VPDEQNQAPGLRDSVRSVEGGHAAQTNSIFNCGVRGTKLGAERFARPFS
jgi:hypothetical protein